uniref:DNAJ-containing protein X-domain domain-containing protein n=1 Tax=Aegilops tauschii subsp. strangulata TaxID=200361 RepID=A0A453RKL0_AEGTS
GAIALMQLQEDLKKQMGAEGQTTEEELEVYMQNHKKVMVDSLWKLNVADIEATISHVCQMVLQDPLARKDDLRLRAKGLKTLGKIFQGVKLNSGEGEGSHMKNIDNMDDNAGSSPDSSPKREPSFNPIPNPPLTQVVAPKFSSPVKFLKTAVPFSHCKYIVILTQWNCIGLGPELFLVLTFQTNLGHS